MMVLDDAAAMRQALACARSVEGRTSPRPPVGAVVVRDGEVIGQGATAPPYGPHAEVFALREAGERARGATLYVTLEPCCITRHTPPCTEAVIAAGIRRVVVAICDPNPHVCEQGIAQLRAAGIEVTVGVGEEEAREIIQPFLFYISKGRPYVTAKWAMTLDGKLATRTGDSRWISGPRSRLRVHQLRDRVDAILVGAGTLRQDDPQLTVRLPEELRGKPRQGPLRVVISASGNVPQQSRLFSSELAEGTCLIVGEGSERRELLQRLRERGVSVLAAPLDARNQVDLDAALRLLAQEKDCMHVLLEGGSHLLGSALDCRLVDHVQVFIAPKVVGGSTASSPVAGVGLALMSDAFQLQHMYTEIVEHDMLIEGDIYYGPGDGN
ncbi:bifunctional diaminohydroxyphosphoribosylaminopyrimidine deaminase/5-amino-6-(5-phosphoribosylamino)uracil reductase RibD [Thermosporothrix hazakensis]|nr:bifunctional diaminohydroxyphosphoribosylaminopyrimidine deaminase/5-amino-6-(5-phosphoribosylamino)uracil reductase RibD [Thermosporothrix hazakensis]GCE50988.1 riboflavin biosynthesis protein RibD [Thermosporothrix hazakensis]